METLTEREQSVLEAVIRSYIADPSPVASSRIHHNSSSATIRMVMNDLENKCYLRQPHTSAGRVPTGKAYRFFVDNCIKSEKSTSNMPRRRLTHIRDWYNLLQSISEKTQLLAIATYGSPPTILYFGMGEVLEAPEFDDPLLARKLGHLIDSLLHNQAVNQIYAPFNATDTRAFIEEENPFPEARFASILSRSFNDGVILTVGPSRMNYETTFKILRSL
jgi:transcriptional regulator of heat shock response